MEMWFTWVHLNAIGEVKYNYVYIEVLFFVEFREGVFKTTKWGDQK